jgi:cytoskeletal protein CcmA (bactofilin family)
MSQEYSPPDGNINDSGFAAPEGSLPGNDAQGPATVILGNKMPGHSKKLPVLGSSSRAGAASQVSSSDSQQPRSEIADGLNFVGNAVLSGVCTVNGRVEGNLKQAQGVKIAVIVTETGYVKGDIVADQISVMGRTEGLLDAAGGSVSLHDSANVSGHVRYHRIQVNGSDLNATLERSPAKSQDQGFSGGSNAFAPAPTYNTTNEPSQ